MIIMKGSESSKVVAAVGEVIRATGVIIPVTTTMTAISTPLTIVIPVNIITVARLQRESGYLSE